MATTEPYCKIDDDGTSFWYRDDTVLHRDGGPAVYRDGFEAWWRHGELHRGDGPAVTVDGHRQEWWQHGQLHRVDGPAIAYDSGAETWCIHGWQLDGERLDAFRSAPVARRELISDLYAAGVCLADAMATAARIG